MYGLVEYLQYVSIVVASWTCDSSKSIWATSLTYTNYC